MPCYVVIRGFKFEKRTSSIMFKSCVCRCPTPGFLGKGNSPSLATAPSGNPHQTGPSPLFPRGDMAQNTTPQNMPEESSNI